MLAATDCKAAGMTYLDEMDFGDEIRGVICPNCGGSLVWNKGKAFCYDHGKVRPEPEQPTSAQLRDEDRQWLEDHRDKLEPEIE
jgi:uncharacterized Zn finger protein (UPF0148 family)